MPTGLGSVMVRTLLGVLLAGQLLGCDNRHDGTTVVQLWAFGREGEVLEALLPEFERRNPGVRVRVQQIPWSAAHEKLLTAYAGGVMPDVFQLGNTWIPEFVALHALERLDERIERSASVRLDDYFSGILATNVIGAATWGVPWYVDTRLLFYRADLLARAGYERAPATHDEWLDAMRRLKAVAGEDGYAILLPLNEWQPQVIIALGFGAELLRDGDRYGQFESESFRAAFELYVDLFRQRLAPVSSGAEFGNLYRDFAGGRFAMLVTGPWNIGEFRRRLPERLQGAWSTAPIPGADARRPGPSLAGGASLVISRGSPRKEAAWRLVEYLSEAARQVEFYRLTGDLPARRSAWQASGLVEDPHARAFFEQLQTVVSTPKIPEWERIASAITRYSEAAVRGAMSVDEALHAIDRDVDAMLAKRRWMLARYGATP